MNIVDVVCDESADEKKERVVFVVAGVVGLADSWARLTARWVARTHSVAFHANDCDSDRGAYAQIAHADNKALYRDLVTAVAESEVGGWAFAIDLAAQNEIFPGSGGLAYYKGLVELMTAMKNFAAYNNVNVRFTFYSRAESEHNATLIFTSIRSEANEFERLIHPELSFVPSRTEPRLQIADLFAREAMKTYDNRFGVGQKRRPPRRSWLALRETGRFHIEAISRDWFEDLRANMPRIEELTGMSFGEYAQWFTSNRKQDCLTSRFQFWAWKGSRPAEVFGELSVSSAARGKED